MGLDVIDKKATCLCWRRPAWRRVPPGRAMDPFLATSRVCSSFLPSWICVCMVLSSQSLVKMKGFNIDARAAPVLSEGTATSPHLQQVLQASRSLAPIPRLLCPSTPPPLKSNFTFLCQIPFPFCLPTTSPQSGALPTRCQRI